MNPDDQNFLVVGTIEDSDAAAVGDSPGISPQKVVVELFG
jgi:hypothetical protein